MKIQLHRAYLLISAGMILIGCHRDSTHTAGMTNEYQSATPETEHLQNDELENAKMQKPDIDLNRAIKDLYRKVDDNDLVAYNAFSDCEKVFYATWPAGCEICNGGFHQWYRSVFGLAAKDTPDAYRAIGANKCAEIVEKANRLFGENGPPRQRTERIKLLKEIDKDALEKLNDEFFAVEEDTATMHDEYVESNWKHFSVYRSEARR